MAALDDLGVTGDDLDSGGCRGGSHGFDDGGELGEGEPFFKDEAGAEVFGDGSRDGEVVDGPVDRQLADRAAGKAQRLDDEAVAAERQRHAAGRHRAGVPECGEGAVGAGEGGDEQPLDQRLRGLAARAVRERDPRVAKARGLGPRRLDDREHPLLAIAGKRLGGAHTASLGRRMRP